jgi:hypothetical protein
MAEFKIKNLMVDILNKDLIEKIGPFCKFPTRYCRYFISPCLYPTEIACPNQTIDCFVSDGCGVNYSGCYRTDLWVLDTKTLVINPEDILVVRKQMDELFKAIEVRAAEVKVEMRPQNLKQVQVLEDQLNVALEELQRIKAELGGKK